MLAIGAMSALSSAGIKIPGDVAVLGFDNINMCRFISPGLTTVAQPMHEIGKESARLLLEKILNGNTGTQKQVIFQPEIVERGSV
jgi:LacI family transcriptional regulator